MGESEVQGHPWLCRAFEVSVQCRSPYLRKKRNKKGRLTKMSSLETERRLLELAGLGLLSVITDVVSRDAVFVSFTLMCLWTTSVQTQQEANEKGLSNMWAMNLQHMPVSFCSFCDIVSLHNSD